MALKLRDISNLPLNLPVSQIPQQVSSCSSFMSLDQWTQQRSSFQVAVKRPVFNLQQRRVAALLQDDSGCGVMDDSLTDMQWLQRMDAGSDFPGLAHGQKKMGKVGRGGIKDGCRKKLEYNNSKKDTNKPPLSYASLISLAICSTPQRMMTLSSIYRWIEYTFPFYRTPEAKAWKNSIRHNLSIRKNMFMKVYQYPPRRGNGSYWTLLSDGEEELKKAIPLFATLQPPVIDTNCAYHKEPSTHVVKSKGKFIPVLPRSDMNTSLPFFSLGNNMSSVVKSCSAAHSIVASNEVVVEDSINDNSEHLMSADEDIDYEAKEETLAANVMHFPIKRPKHLHDHSYAKGLSLQEVNDLIDGTVNAEVVELAAGVWDKGMGRENDRFAAPSTPKRKKKLPVSRKGKYHPLNSTTNQSCFKPRVSGVGSALGDSPSFTTPTKEQDSSLNLLDSSLLTPLKNLVPDVEIGTISFSPLYVNLATPKQGKVTHHLLTSDAQSHPYFPSPFTPLKGSFDSGIFSPLRTDSLGGMKFSTTPTNMSPLGDLNSFGSLQPELCPLKVLDSSGGTSSTPLRPGSLQAFGLPGLTPPTRK